MNSTSLLQTITPNLSSKASGIYLILCIATGDMYIGQSTSIQRRFAQHKGYLKAKKHQNIRLQRLHNKYGLNMLSFIVLEHCLDLTNRERYWLNLIDDESRLNFLEPNETPSWKGKTHSEETKKRISISHIGIKHSAETKERLRIVNLGRKCPGVVEANKKRAKPKIENKGKPRSEDTKRKIKESWIKRKADGSTGHKLKSW